MKKLLIMIALGTISCAHESGAWIGFQIDRNSELSQADCYKLCNIIEARAKVVNFESAGSETNTDNGVCGCKLLLDEQNGAEMREELKLILELEKK